METTVLEQQLKTSTTKQNKPRMQHTFPQFQMLLILSSYSTVVVEDPTAAARGSSKLHVFFFAVPLPYPSI